MRAIILAMLLVLLASPALALDCDFTTSDRWLLGGYYAALAADLQLTRRVRDEQQGSELNPLLPDRPTDAQLGLAGLLAAGTVTAAACYLPEWRHDILGLAFVLEIAAMMNNQAELRIHIQF